MKVLVIGSGGREHALCHAIAASPNCSTLFCAPGNAGIASVATCVPIGAEDIADLVNFAKTEAVDLVVIGPEAPLIKGLMDILEKAGIPTFGTNADAAILEGSKVFMKDLCGKYDIPTGAYERFDEPDAAKEYIRVKGAPIVVKADGLAAGKGVVLCHNLNAAFAAVDHIMSERIFGDAGSEVVIEEFLVGEEVSFFALVDGTHAIPFASAQDHKAAHDGDTGPNTGGMGAYSPAPIVTDALQAEIMETIVHPTVKAMAAEGRPFKGVLFCGIMVEDGVPKVLEYNVRFGDPECQVMLPRLKNDILDILLAAAEGRLNEIEPELRPETALTVVLATTGYPGYYEKGSEINNIAAAEAMEGITVYHAGTSEKDGKLVATGGRVLNVTALGASVKDAQARAYQAVDAIDWPEGFCRRDIGWRAIAREENE
ncbi:MAG: phosphoribosylamine--glycine ligase [Magnetospiraceae bacterium]